MLSETSQGLVGSLARVARLQFDDAYKYNEPIYLNNDESLKSAKIKKPLKKPLKSAYLRVNPNPAIEFITVSYDLNSSLNATTLVITDPLGKTIYTKELKNVTDQLMLIVKDYAKGNYLCTIFNNGKPVQSAKFIKM